MSEQVTDKTAKPDPAEPLALLRDAIASLKQAAARLDDLLVAAAKSDKANLKNSEARFALLAAEVRDVRGRVQDTLNEQEG